MSRAVAVAALIVALTPGLARGDAAADLSQARARYAAQEYEAAAALLTPHLARRDLPPALRRDILEVYGLAQLVLGERREAARAFEELVELDPDHRLRDPSGSPKLRGFFEAVRRRVRPASLSHTRPEAPRAGALAHVAVAAPPGPPPREVALYYRVEGEPRYRRLTLARTPRGYEVRFRLPDRAESYALAYYVTARDARGRLVGRVGAALRPVLLEVAGRQAVAARIAARRPFYERWWFWTLVSAVVTAGVVTAVVVTLPQAPEGNLPPGQVTLPLLRFP